MNKQRLRRTTVPWPGLLLDDGAFRLLALMVPAILLVISVAALSGDIVYALDDAYIHLAMAEQIARAHYGINPGEFAAASSSILWPFLLVPLIATPAGVYLPLAINLAALATTLFVIDRWLRTFLSSARALAASAIIGLLFNLYALPLSGMEHSLQVMLVAIIAVMLVEQRATWPFWLAVMVLPLVRYEGLAISLPVLGWFMIRPEHRAKAFATAVLLSLLVGVFSLFLYRNGVGFLPSSVQVRDGTPDVLQIIDVRLILINASLQPLFVLLALAAAMLYLFNRRPLEATLFVMVPTLLHLSYGRYGDFARYHIYFAIWVSILFLDLFAHSRLVSRPLVRAALAIGLTAGSTDTLLVTVTAPYASRNIADQDGEAASIVHRFLKESVAIHDLGLMAFRSRNYVLDLAGLASYEALQLQQGDLPTGVWFSHLMEKHQVEHAIVFDKWYGPQLVDWRPAGWLKVGSLKLPPPCVTPGDFDLLSFYSTGPDAAARLELALTEYQRSSPRAAMMLELVRSQEKSVPTAAADACDDFYGNPVKSNFLVKALYVAFRKIKSIAVSPGREVLTGA